MTTYLKKGDKLNSPHGVYTIESVIGRGATAVAYLTSYDNGRGLVSRRVLKECYPTHLNITRTDSGELVCKANHKVKFEEIKKQFEDSGAIQNEVRNISGIKNHIPPITNILHSNNTVYLDIIEFEGEVWDRKSMPTLLERVRICLSVSKLVKLLHDSNYLCLDLKPSNIYILNTVTAAEDYPHFIDFDSVRKKNKLSFGNSLSFTKTWSAPEQRNPFGYHKINEATDIYALGELVFWSVFNRHSTYEENRPFSEYNFSENTEFAQELQRKTVQALLTSIFENTIITSVKRRFQTVDKLIELLEALVDELQKKEYLITSLPEPNQFFVGRDIELCNIQKYLENNKKVFLYGVSGIGKSEIAKQYIKQSSKKYKDILYWVYSGDLDAMICDETNVKITNIEQNQEQSNSSYCRYKLSKLKELLDDNSLIVIDNFDISEADNNQKATWDLLMSLPGKILITTKVKQLENVLTIEEIASKESLRKLFIYNYCGDENTLGSSASVVDEIVDVLCNHTLLIELIAKQARNTSPSCILESLKQTGFESFSKDYIGLRKDGQSLNATIQEHIYSVFKMSSMTFEQKCVLTKIALMPPAGIGCADFKTFYSIKTFNDINWLIDNGWIYRENGANALLKIHPIIAKIAMEASRANEDVINKVLTDSIEAIGRRNKPNNFVPIEYGTETETSFEKVRVKCADSIAESLITFGIHNKRAAVLLTRYVGDYLKYGNRQFKFTACTRAISIFKETCCNDKYSAIVECSYQRYAALLNVFSKKEEAIRLAEERLKVTIKNKDYISTTWWCSILAGLYTLDSIKGYYYYFKTVKYYKKVEKLLKSKTINCTDGSNIIDNFDYDYLSSNILGYAVSSALSLATHIENLEARDLYNQKASRYAFRQANKIRTCIQVDQELHNTPNSIEIKINEARIAFLSCDYSAALDILNSIVDMYERNSSIETTTHLRVHYFMANIAFLLEDFVTAEHELEVCVDINKKLQRGNDYSLCISLGRVYTEMKNLEKASELNESLYQEILTLDDDVKEIYLPGVTYNIACLNVLQGNKKKALYKFFEAIKLYGMINNDEDSKNLGIARSYHRGANLCTSDVSLLTRIHRKDGEDATCKWMFEKAIEYYKLSINKNHPDYVRCLQEFKSLNK